MNPRAVIGINRLELSEMAKKAKRQEMDKTSKCTRIDKLSKFI